MQSTVFDAHCDTIFELVEQKKDLYTNDLQLDMKRMEEYAGYIQVFAAFVDQKNIRTSPIHHCLQLVECYHRQITKNKEKIAHCTTIEEIKKTLQQGKAASILYIEGAEVFEGDLSALWMFYRLGVRLVTLTWNYANELADGILEPRGGGLTGFGAACVKEMNHLGIAVDVSHLSEKGFWDVERICEQPFIASHSNAKVLCSHPRNLNDEQIKAIIHHGGCIGINFYPEFLTDKPDCTIADIFQHIAYIFTLGGGENIGFGSDFDGVEALPDGFNGIQNMKDILTGLQQLGYTEREIENISHKNFLRTLAHIWKN